MRKNLRVLGEYVGHLVVGAGLFAALLSFGIGLKLLVQWAEPLLGHSPFAQLMTIVEEVILYSDIVFVIWWTIFSTYNAILELHDE
jgi:hypothetical protein